LREATGKNFNKIKEVGINLGCGFLSGISVDRA
jgi:hypothetical protein